MGTRSESLDPTLLTRLRQIGWSWWLAIGVSALVRGSYHLYQGFGGFAGNLVMGVAFAALFLRWKRTGPLVVATVFVVLPFRELPVPRPAVVTVT